MKSDSPKSGSVWPMVISAAALLVGGVLWMLMHPVPTEGPWVDYLRGLYGTGWMMMIFGAIWLGLSILRYFTHFFDVDRPLGGDVYVMLVAGTLLVCAVVLWKLLPVLPPGLPDPLPTDLKVRDEIVRGYGNLRLLVTAIVLFTGGAFLSFPSRRFFAH